MGTKIHAYTRLLYRVVSYHWPFITMGSIFQSAVGSIYGCGTHTQRTLYNVLFLDCDCLQYFFFHISFQWFGHQMFIFVDIYQWIFRSHYYFILFIIIGKLLLLSLQNSPVLYSLYLLSLAFQLHIC